MISGVSIRSGVNLAVPPAYATARPAARRHLSHALPDTPVGAARSVQHFATLPSGEPASTNARCGDCGPAAEMGGGALLACRGGRSAPFLKSHSASLPSSVVRLNRSWL
jgi:hypothetical protein